MDDLSALRDVVRAELANSQALRDVKSLMATLTGEYQSPAAEVRTAEGLHRQLESLDRQIDALFDQWAEVGCSIF